MRTWRRSVVAALIAVSLSLPLTVFTFLGFVFLKDLAHIGFGVDAGVPSIEVIPEAGAGPQALPPGFSLHPTTEFYYRISYTLAIVVSICICVAMFLVSAKPRFETRAVVYLGLLVITLPATMYSYLKWEQLFPSALQVIPNLLIIYLGASVAFWLASLSTADPDTRVLRFLALALVVFGAVCVPAIFSLNWYLFTLGLSVDKAAVTAPQLSTVGGIVSAVVGVLNYRREIRKQLIADAASGGPRVRLQ